MDVLRFIQHNYKAVYGSFRGNDYVSCFNTNEGFSCFYVNTLLVYLFTFNNNQDNVVTGKYNVLSFPWIRKLVYIYI